MIRTSQPKAKATFENNITDAHLIRGWNSGCQFGCEVEWSLVALLCLYVLRRYDHCRRLHFWRHGGSGSALLCGRALRTDILVSSPQQWSILIYTSNNSNIRSASSDAITIAEGDDTGSTGVVAIIYCAVERCIPINWLVHPNNDLFLLYKYQTQCSCVLPQTLRPLLRAVLLEARG